jgi:proteasome assembly chaperone (PAC2) family protein
MALITLDDSFIPDSPVLVAALDGWVNGGQAGTLAAEQLADGGRVVATFDPDRLFDFRSRRPTLDVIDGKLAGIEWPRLELTSTRVGERDLLVLTGGEPDFVWRELAGEVRTLVRRLKVTSWVTLGAIPSTVAHTRPVPVLGTASSPGLLPAGVTQGPMGHLRVPAAAISVLEHAVSEAGIPSIGFFAQVPHYASGSYPSAAIALLSAVGQYLAVELPIGELGKRALETRSLLDAATSGDERTRTYVESLEQAADAAGTRSADDLIADIERYLREGSPDGGDREGGGGGRPN